MGIAVKAEITVAKNTENTLPDKPKIVKEFKLIRSAGGAMLKANAKKINVKINNFIL
ncbi:MAG: hypothetical protein KDD56_00645 [Bdellovibrionales bacterium]|nr:hypothetical protein [Bdellovibrionales bacterium]